jgi:hypothetical protein
LYNRLSGVKKGLERPYILLKYTEPDNQPDYRHTYYDDTDGKSGSGQTAPGPGYADAAENYAKRGGRECREPVDNAKKRYEPD